jgi:Zn-dependent M16 (insulinase) family peptidase
LDYALSYASSGYRESVRRNERLQTSRFMCNFGANFLRTSFVKNYLEELHFHFVGILNVLLTKECMSFAVHSSKDMFDQIQRRIELMLHTIKTERRSFLDTAASKTQNEDEENPLPVFEKTNFKTHFVLPMQVNYVVESIAVPGYTHPDTPKLHILSEILSQTELHREIREQGGAYAGGSSLTSNGTFNFYSYRDPHVLQTYEAFEKSMQWASKGEMTNQDIKDSKISLFAKVDRVVEPQNKGLRKWVYGITDDMRDEYRKRLLDVSKQDLVDVAEKYLYTSVKKGETSQVIFGSQNNDLETLMQRGWKIERPVEELSVQEGSYEQNKKPEPAIID